jgi:hypothetical protein
MRRNHGNNDLRSLGLNDSGAWPGSKGDPRRGLGNCEEKGTERRCWKGPSGLSWLPLHINSDHVRWYSSLLRTPHPTTSFVSGHNFGIMVLTRWYQLRHECSQKASRESTLAGLTLRTLSLSKLVGRLLAGPPEGPEDRCKLVRPQDFKGADRIYQVLIRREMRAGWNLAHRMRADAG